jgi:hypothetical protein
MYRGNSDTHKAQLTELPRYNNGWIKTPDGFVFWGGGMATTISSSLQPRVIYSDYDRVIAGRR